MISTPEERVATLTPRELDVARLAARGFSARYIADRYTLSARTFETHIRHIYEKLEIGHRDVLIERYAHLLLARGGDILTPAFEPKLAPIIPIGVTIAPAPPVTATSPPCDAICDAASGGSCFTPWCRCSCHRARS